MASSAASPEPVLFSRDVLPVLTKAGCNAGGCHGATDGKGGFKLSLFGESWENDFREVTEGDNRVVTGDPDRSWMLRKPTLDMPHEGGERFAFGSEEYAILRRWIEEGAHRDPEDAPRIASVEVSPADTVTGAGEEVALEVVAEFTDGARRDVTRWATYASSDLAFETTPDGTVAGSRPGETAVTATYLGQRDTARIAFLPPRPDWEWRGPEPANPIDEVVFAKLRKLKTNPAAVCDDSTFIRRVTLDIAGRIPAADEVVAFLGDTAPDKRRRLVDRLLESDGFADYWTLKWSDLLRVEEKALDETGVREFQGWIRRSIAGGKRIDDFAWDILTATGSTYRNGAANFYRSLREPTLRGERVAQVFLGTRVNCAKCHNHPFERWTQDDYYRFAASFDQIGYDILENERRDRLDKNSFNGEQVVHLYGKAELRDPRDGKRPRPGVLGGSGYAVEEGTDRLRDVADWLTRQPQFARVQANRVWYHLMGTGVVDPPDDFRASNPPSDPALLELLAGEFEASGYDLRSLVRAITSSLTYQLSSEPPADDPGDLALRNFARAGVRRLDAEVTLDAIGDFLGVRPGFYGVDAGTRAVQVPGVIAQFGRVKATEGDRFLKAFGKPLRLLNSEAERAGDAALEQVFALLGDGLLNRAIADPDNALGGLLDECGCDDEAVARLYLAALGRPPTGAEAKALAAAAAAAPDRRAAIEDIAWALVNSKEFLFRH